MIERFGLVESDSHDMMSLVLGHGSVALKYLDFPQTNYRSKKFSLGTV